MNRLCLALKIVAVKTWLGYRPPKLMWVVRLTVVAIWLTVPCTTTSWPTCRAASAGVIVGTAATAYRENAAGSRAIIVTSLRSF